MRISGAFFLLAAVFALNAGLARAESGLSGAPILNRPVGARSSGMGRAFTGVPGDAESLMYNPAGPAFVPGTGVYMAYMNGFSGGNYGFAAVPVKTGKFVVTPAFLGYNSGKMDLNLSDGTRGSVVGELDKVGMISAAYTLRPDLAIGATFKFTSINLAETASASARYYDLGLLYAMKNGLSFGAASLNNGDAIKFEEKSDPAPKTLRAGVSYKVGLKAPDLSDFSNYELVLASDWSKSYKEKGYYQSGFEINMKIPDSIILSLRLGYLMNRPEEGFTFGFGVKKDNWSFGFGYETSKDLDVRLPVSVSCEF